MDNCQSQGVEAGDQKSDNVTTDLSMEPLKHRTCSAWLSALSSSITSSLEADRRRNARRGSDLHAPGATCHQHSHGSPAQSVPWCISTDAAIAQPWSQRCAGHPTPGATCRQRPLRSQLSSQSCWQQMLLQSDGNNARNLRMASGQREGGEIKRIPARGWRGRRVRCKCRAHSIGSGSRCCGVTQTRSH